MADFQRLLGTMLATGMAGRSSRGPGFAASPFGMGARVGGGGFKQKAGLAALGYLAYKTYQDYQKNRTGSATRDEASGQSGGPWGRGGDEALQRTGGSFGERLSKGLKPQETERDGVSAYPEVQLEDQKALLLIRAMIAAANADGEISSEERARILAAADEAGAGPEEHSALERELERPLAIDELLRHVRDEETAEQVYLASQLAMHPDTPAEQAYMQFLAARLRLDPDRVKALRGVA